ncbi:MAG: phosphoglycolate phosphatase [Candidatus Poseidoniaceae archaeon]|jgi:phosphoglycolate phosphatase (TIGR01487 family)|tara:strand:- start:1004 stop:1735 length:732 start_codon:yes stop_codon:yes gene_type:complete
MEWLPKDWHPKFVAVDIDGTLTDDKKQLNTRALDALRELEDAGIPVILATGNVRAITYGLWRFLKLTGPICCENGGVLWHPTFGDPIFQADGAEAKRAAEWLSTVMPVNAKGIESNQWRESEWCLEPNEDLELIRTKLSESEWSHLSALRTGFAIHLMEPHLSKGSGLEIILDRMGWSKEDMLCVGDAPNDLSMFETAHWSVAVKGAFDSVSDAADVCSPHFHGDTFEPLVEAILKAQKDSKQ